MNKITDRKAVNALGILLMLTYTVSYITRINYGAVISEIVTAENISRATASLALTGSAVTYGFGQIVSGYMGDKIQPKRLVLMGLITTLLMNIILPFCKTTFMTTAVWCVNGLAQAFMWPPFVKIMSSLLNADDYKRTVVRVTWGSSIGTMLVYGASPICIHFFGWHSVFIAAAVCAALMIIFWIKKCPSVENTVTETDTSKASVSYKFPFSAMLVIILVIIALQGALRDGITTWLPSFISETFNLSNEISILTGFILPIFTILVSQLTLLLSQRLIKNELLLAGTMFGIGCLSAFGLSLFGTGNIIISLLFMALLSGSMHGVNHVVTGFLPPYFKKYGCVSLASGLLNSCTYIGSAISTYGIAVFSDCFGWGKTLWLWTSIAFIGTTLSLAMIKKWASFKK